MSEPVCTGIVGCVWAFQTVATGVLAIVGAVITAVVIYRAARLPVKAERDQRMKAQRRKFRLQSLEMSEELKLLAKRARQGQGTVKVHKAANSEVTEDTREKMRLHIPRPTQDWEYMSLLPEAIARDIFHLNSMIGDHNFDIERAGGAFGDDNFGRSITDRLQDMQAIAGDLSDRVLKMPEPPEIRTCDAAMASTRA